ncbi:LOW QUALITY PROTEIN: uncharacterized protein LOC105425514 [Pogonomyrmex barbatus]|uniref:LOW QUALITY PROTEIN: uncharacterized protein LOC105425514 n=1 Tax=Pogonomyrmex barbatus TaxID=144034 RepID=A0A6I9W0Z1_9HYME|nr:LOW QUALITY PROTEIN: uncharacterized protein LOC105425514 [Pogonomyrmex barbatus]
MADNKEPKEDNIDGHMEVKVEPNLQCYVEEEHESGFSSLENASAIPSSVDVGALNLWTSKATTCLIRQYKKYRSMVGQSTQIRSLREMFEMISLEMQNYGFYFSPQKCENKWRVLERKYKNIVSRERQKKPGRMRHYGQWEHKPALDEIFNETRHMYLETNEPQPPCGSAKYPLILPKSDCDQGGNSPGDRQREDSLASTINKKDNDTFNHQRFLSFDKFIEEIGKYYALAEKNKERRHEEKMAAKHKELELQKQLLKLKEQKMELQKCQMIAAVQNLRLNMK